MSESPLDGILRREHPSRILLTRLACISLLAAVMCSCQSTQHPAASPSSTTAAPAPTTSTAPAVRIQPWTLTLDPSSATAWASFTAAHLRDHVAFIRDDLVLEAPIIEEQVTSGRIVQTTQTAQFAGQLAQLAGRPA